MKKKKLANLVIKNIGELAICENDNLTIIKSAALAVQDGVILWHGKENLLEANVKTDEKTEIIDASGGVVTPGFIDCHTHLIFAGNRENEFVMRMEGKDYLEILSSGGGILSTVRATVKATEEELIQKAFVRLKNFLYFGVTTCEIKSGYGLETETELKILRVAKQLSKVQPVKIITTFLGAHAIPEKFKNNRGKYVEIIKKEMIPLVAEEKLAKFCDVYLEKSAFTYEETEEILETAISYGLRPKIHAGQFNDLGGAELGAKLGAVSIDHLDHVSDEGLEKMAENGVVGVTLPGASFFTRQKPAECDRWRKKGVKVAVSTDFNPGTSPTQNLPLMMTMSVIYGRLSLEDAFLGVTSRAASALNLPSLYGTLAKGAPADILIHRIDDWRKIITHYGVSHIDRVIIDGKVVLQT